MSDYLSKFKKYSEPKRRSPIGMFQLALFVVLVLLLLGALVSGVSIYKSVNDQRETDRQDRVGLSLIANSIHMNDATGAVGVGAGPEGRALVLTEHLASGDYETRIYAYQGNIVEEYSLAGKPYTPQRATQLVASKTFSFSYGNGLLAVSTDQGSIKAALRSTEGTASS